MKYIFTGKGYGNVIINNRGSSEKILEGQVFESDRTLYHLNNKHIVEYNDESKKKFASKIENKKARIEDIDKSFDESEKRIKEKHKNELALLKERRDKAKVPFKKDIVDLERIVALFDKPAKKKVTKKKAEKKEEVVKEKAEEVKEENKDDNVEEVSKSD